MHIRTSTPTSLQPCICLMEELLSRRTLDFSRFRDSVNSTLCMVKGVPMALSLQQTTMESLVGLVVSTSLGEPGNPGGRVSKGLDTTPGP